MTDIKTSQNIDLSSWDILYIGKRKLPLAPNVRLAVERPTREWRYRSAILDLDTR
jgi:hypothetical protein